MRAATKHRSLAGRTVARLALHRRFEPAEARFARVLGRVARGAALGPGDSTFYIVYSQTPKGRRALAGGAQ